MAGSVSQSPSLHNQMLLILQLNCDRMQPQEHFVLRTSPGCLLLGHSFPVGAVEVC